MNILRKVDEIEIFFYEEDATNDPQNLRSAFEEMLEIINLPRVRLKFCEVTSFRLESLALIFSFFKTLKQKGITSELLVPERLEHFLKQFHTEKIPDLTTKLEHTG
jgi:hypothetical protein